MRIPYRGGCRVTSPYGERILNGTNEFHAGIDLLGLNGDRTLIAPCDGIIEISRIVPKSTGDRTWEWGNYVRILSSDGYHVYMCHMAERRVSAGQKVAAGQTIIGIQGNTGYSFGEHCHFEVRRNGGIINPAPLLGIENKEGVYLTGPSLAFKTGDRVSFTGNTQYAFASSSKAVEASPCVAKVSDTYPKGKHPYHVIGDGVYGWVNRSDVSAAVGIPYKVKVYKLNVRKDPGMSSLITKVLSYGDIVLVEEVNAYGWGKLSSGDGWIALQYAEKA